MMQRKREQQPASPAGRVTFRPGGPSPRRPASPGVRQGPQRAPAPGRPARLRRRPGPGSGPAVRHWSRPPDGPAYNCTPGRSAVRPAGWPSDGPAGPPGGRVTAS